MELVLPKVLRINVLALKIQNARQLWGEKGFNALLRTSGWKLIAAIVAYYIVRDVTLYILIPLVVLKGMH